MANDKSTGTATAPAKAKVAYELQSGPAPAEATGLRKQGKLTALMSQMTVGGARGWFYIDRRDGKVDTSKRANVVRIAKKLGIEVKIYAESKDLDVVKRIK